MANEGGKKPELARAAALHKTIPDGVANITTSTTPGEFDLAALALTEPAATTVDCRGKGITLQAITADCTIIRKAAGNATHGQGHVLVAGAPPEYFYVDPDEITRVSWDAAGAGTLQVCVDIKHAG